MCRLPFLLLAFLLSARPAATQTKKIDSLKLLVTNAANPQQKIAAIKALGEQRNSLSTDTLYAYSLQLKRIALQTKNDEAVMAAEEDIALYHAAKGRLDTALQIVSAQLKKAKADGGERHLSLLLARGRLLYRANRYKEALQELFATLNAAEKAGNAAYQMMAKTGIGWLQLDLKQYPDALAWFYKALNTPGAQPYLNAYAALYSNLATAHKTLGHTDSALHYIRKAIGTSRRNQSLGYLATSLRIYADILMQQKQYAGAEAALQEMVSIRTVSDASFFVNYDMSLLAQFYAKTGQPEKGIALCKAVIDSAHKSGITTQLYLMYDALAANYKAAGNYKAYGETLERSNAMQDSLQTLNTGQLIAALQGQNELQKKENVIIQQKLDIVQKKLWLYGLAAFVLFALMLAVVLFKQYNKRQRLKLLLMQQEEKRLAEKAVHEAEEAERKRISADLHDSLGAYAASIASNIQQLEASVGENGVLPELRSNAQAIVSQLNDTIWVLKKDALLLTSISDRLKLFIQKISPSHPHITIDVLEDVQTDHLLPPAQAFHLFQIIKEAVINALKHSGCSQVVVCIKAAETWQVSVADNGKRIYKEAVLAEGGNGVQNMKARAEESGWRIEWQRAAGTKVVVEPAR